MHRLHDRYMELTFDRVLGRRVQGVLSLLTFSSESVGKVL